MRLIFVFSFVFQISRKQFSFFKVIIVITYSWTFSSAIPLISSTEPVRFLYLPDTTALVSSKCSVLSTLYFAILSGGLNFFPFFFEIIDHQLDILKNCQPKDWSEGLISKRTFVFTCKMDISSNGIYLEILIPIIPLNFLFQIVPMITYFIDIFFCIFLFFS